MLRLIACIYLKNKRKRMCSNVYRKFGKYIIIIAKKEINSITIERITHLRLIIFRPITKIGYSFILKQIGFGRSVN